MRLILENWREFVDKEHDEIDEGIGSKLALAGALAGASAPAMAQDTGTGDTGEKTQQVDKSDDKSQLLKNEDGTYSLTLDIPKHFQKLMPSMKRPIMTNWARAEFAKKMAGALDGEVYQLEVSGRLTAMTPDTITFTGNASAKK